MITPGGKRYLRPVFCFLVLPRNAVPAIPVSCQPMAGRVLTITILQVLDEANKKPPMKIGKFEISTVFKKERYKTVYSALSDQSACLLHEYVNPEIAEHEFMLSRYLHGASVDQFVERFQAGGKTFLAQAPSRGLHRRCISGNPGRCRKKSTLPHRFYPF